MKRNSLTIVLLVFFSLFLYAQHKMVIYRNGKITYEINTADIDSFAIVSSAVDPTPTPTNPYKPVTFPKPEAVDLGLPSGTKWAQWNLGATREIECGGYYGWGDPTGNLTQDDRSSLYHYGSDITGTSSDIITVKWGKGWSIPTMAQYEELAQYTDMTYARNYLGSDLNGWIFTSLKDDTKSIFIPDAGFIDKTGKLQSKGTSGVCWTGQWEDNFQCAYRTGSVTTNNIEFATSAPALQLPIRGVYSDDETGGGGGGSTPSTDMGVSPAQLVDLGITDTDGNKVLWATCNLGATTATGFGGFYTWGGDGPQTDYTIDAYTHYTENIAAYDESTTDDLLLPEYDTAHNIWKGSWRMPTLVDMQRLKENCTWTWKDNYNGSGVSGYVVNGCDGYQANSIFLPAAGYKTGREDDPSGNYFFQNETGYYWTSADYTRDGTSTYAYYFMFLSNEKTNTALLRHKGASIRPVMTKK